MNSEITLSSTDFKTKVLDSPRPVLVAFLAPWSMPCKVLIPHLKDIAESYADMAKVATVNIDKEVELTAKYGIVSIPTLLIFKNGRIVQQRSGTIPKNDIEKMLHTQL